MSRSRLQGLAEQFSSSSVASKPASVHTARYNAEFAKRLPLDTDFRDFDDATRGLIESEESLVIKNNLNPKVNAWSMDPYNFIRQRGPQAPDTVNPSLWRQSRLNNIHGLFEVVPGGKVPGIGGIYQVRGYDISNITFIEGEKGVIVVDPAITVECAAAMLALYRKHRGPRPVTAVIITRW